MPSPIELDSSGNGNNAVAQNGPGAGPPSLGYPSLPGSRSFDASRLQQFVAPPSAVYSNLPQITISMWYYPIAYDASLFTMGPATGFTWPFTYLDTNGSISASLFDDTTDIGTITTTTIPLNQWTHILVAGDFDGDKLDHIYINGVEATYLRQPTAPNFFDNSGRPSYFGNDNTADGRAGYMAEVAIWNTVLSSGEIAAAAASTTGIAGIEPTHLVGYWHLDGVADLQAGGTNVFMGKMRTRMPSEFIAWRNDLGTLVKIGRRM
jgi:hypothetical protein